MVIESILVAAAYPAITTAPYELTRACTNKFPIETIDCWSIDGTAIFDIFFN